MAKCVDSHLWLEDIQSSKVQAWFSNHCTGEKAIEQLRDRFGPDIVHDCFAGSELTFEVC